VTYKILNIILAVNFSVFGNQIPSTLSAAEDFPKNPSFETTSNYNPEFQGQKSTNCATSSQESETEFLIRQRSKKYNLSVCAIIKNETKYLKEWIEFHRLIGVEHFYLYSSESIDLLRIMLKPYTQKGMVTLIHWLGCLGQITEEQPEHWALSTQIPAYENAIKFRAVKTTKWLALLNTDEYLVPIHSYTITDLLKQYDSYPAIVLETDVFDGSRANLSPPTQMLIESRDWIKAPPTNICKAFTKLILKPELCTGFIWPPYQIIFKDNQQPMCLNRSDIRINQYVNREKPFIDTLKHKVYINARFMPKSALLELLNQGYAIEDEEQAISRYLPALRTQCLGDSQ
jgi:hypothetical protein